MTVVIVLSVVIILTAIIIACWRNHSRCYKRCLASLNRAEQLAAQGDFRSALAELDKTDAECNCAKFTKGDAPPEYAAMAVYLDRLLDRNGKAAIVEVKRHARGKMLTEMTKEFSSQRIK